MSRKVVTIGGGAGQSRVLAGLKLVKELKDLEVTSIVTAADSGGSSGRLRDEFGVHPWGDILRPSLAFPMPLKTCASFFYTVFQALAIWGSTRSGTSSSLP
jgi:uncharacterized cofD-like protein